MLNAITEFPSLPYILIVTLVRDLQLNDPSDEDIQCERGKDRRGIEDVGVTVYAHVTSCHEDEAGAAIIPGNCGI
jgi:hypothetical protein